MRAFVWLVALAALGAVAFYTTQTYPQFIEADLKQRSSAALTAANLTFAKVSVAGRIVTLSGEAPGATAKEDAVKVAGDVWGVQNVNDTLIVTASEQPIAPQTVIADTAKLADHSAPLPPFPQAQPAVDPAPPPDPAPPSSTFPTIGGLIDPALAPPVDTDSSETESARDPATASAEPAAPSVQQPPAPPVEAPAAPTKVVAATSPPQAAASTPPAPPPAMPPAPAAAPPLPAPAVVASTPIPPATITQGVTTGLSVAVQPPAMPAPVAVAAVTLPAYRLEAHVEGKHIELQGLVSTPSAQRALVAHIRRHIRRADIVDSLTVAHAKPDRDWLGVARKGLSQLSHLDTGSLRLDGRSVAVSGRPKSETDRALVLAALNELPKGYTSTVLLERMQDVAPPVPSTGAPSVAVPTPSRVAPAPVEGPKHAASSKSLTANYKTAPAPAPLKGYVSSECRRRFADVLPRMAVIFQSGSSRVQTSAGRGLDEFARVARSCPRVQIRLTGHSDTQEEPRSAMGLSRERALAVRDALHVRGVASANITVLGRGGTRPAFSNDTADGRENNRRVEFAVW